MENEKKVDMQGLIEKGKSQGSLSGGEIMEAVEFCGYDVDQIEKIYETLEQSGIEVVNYLENDGFDGRKPPRFVCGGKVLLPCTAG